MKKILYMLLCILMLVSCSKPKNDNNIEEIINDINKEECIDYIYQFQGDFDDNYKNFYGATPETWELWNIIDEHFNGYHPGGIVILPEENIISWNIDQRYDIYKITEDDREMMKNLLDWDIYQGVLTPITENTFAATGIFIPSIENEVHGISDIVDFYLKIDNDKLYIILEELTKEELSLYQSDYYFSFIGN